MQPRRDEAMALIGPNVELRFLNAVVGRILMAKDNVTRAKMQTADLALDLQPVRSVFFSLLCARGTVFVRVCEEKWEKLSFL